MKNLKEQLYFKRREKLQLEEDLQKLDDKIHKSSTVLFFAIILFLLTVHFDCTNITAIIIYATVFYIFVPLFIFVKIVKKVNEKDVIEKEINELHNQLNNNKI